MKHLHVLIVLDILLLQLIDISSMGQRMIQRIEDSPKPVIAAIHGSCLGGGSEASLNKIKP